MLGRVFRLAVRGIAVLLDAPSEILRLADVEPTVRILDLQTKKGNLPEPDRLERQGDAAQLTTA